MATATIEVRGTTTPDVEPWCSERVLVVPEMPIDELLRDQAEGLIRFAGAVALKHSSEKQPLHETPIAYGSLEDAVHAAAAGDEQARQMVTANAFMDAIERIFKAGCVTTRQLAVDPAGRLVQHGQLMTSVYVNSLRHTGTSPQMRARLEAEAYNGVRIDYFRRSGLLEKYYFVVISRCPDDMTPNAAADVGFFMDTASCSIQGFTVREDGTPVQESAFVAGRAQPEAERHDAAAIDNMLERLGVPIADRTATGMLQTPLLIPKAWMPNGVADLVPLYDGLFGTFFGQATEVRDYQAHIAQCQERFDELEPIVQRIVDRVLARADTIHTPIQATQALSEESQRCVLDQALADVRINPRVFGEQAAAHIEAARALLAQGDLERFMTVRGEAQQTARSFSCPAEVLGKDFGIEEDKNQEAATSDDECEFVSKECPRCHRKNVLTKVTSREIKGACGCVKLRAA